MYHYLQFSPADIVAKAAAAVAGTDRKAKSEWSKALLQSGQAMEFAAMRAANASHAHDVNLIAQVIQTRAFEIREEYEADRPKMFFLDMFRSNGLFDVLNDFGLRGRIRKMSDWGTGDVRFIGDKSDDWPTTGISETTATLDEFKPIGKAIEYGFMELAQAAREGRDIVAQRTRMMYEDVDRFIEFIIANGAPLHNINGFLNHPGFANYTVPSTTGPNAPNTDWPSKSPDEIIADLHMMRDQSRIDSLYNVAGNTVLISDARYSYLHSALLGPLGESILTRWMRIARESGMPGLSEFVPMVPFDTASALGGPIAIVGAFERGNIDMPLLPVRQIGVENHVSNVKIGYAGMIGSVTIKRPNRFQKWEGI